MRAARPSGVLAPRRHAVLTGGSSGIGLATARLLARRGMHLSIIARDPARLAAAGRAIEGERREEGQRVALFAADVAEREALEEALSRALATLGPPSLLVAAAGYARPGYFLDLPPEEFGRSLAVNHLGAVWAVRAVLPAMRERGGGHIVLISSGAGLAGIFGYTGYSPAKFALRGFAEALAAETRQWRIEVTVVYPPDTDTPGFAEEDRTRPPETRRVAAAARRLSADAVARAILRGVEKRRSAVAPGWRMALFHRLANPFAGVIHRSLGRLTRQTS